MSNRITPVLGVILGRGFIRRFLGYTHQTTWEEQVLLSSLLLGHHTHALELV